MTFFYRGYIIIRLLSVGTEKKIIENLMKLNHDNIPWKINYCTLIYGLWDVLCEIMAPSQQEFIVTVNRIMETNGIREFVREYFQLISTTQNFSIK